MQISKETSAKKLLDNENDQLFIQLAYEQILKRSPDIDGRRFYINQLNKGISKMDVLAQIKESQEGKEINANIPGLNELVEKAKWRKFPLIAALMRKNELHQKQFEIINLLKIIDGKINLIENNFTKSENRIQNTLIEIKEEIDALRIDASTNNRQSTHVDKKEKPQLKEITRDEFDAEWYLTQYPDVAKAGLDPFDHYNNSGKYEQRLALKKGVGFPQLTPISDDEYKLLRDEAQKWPRKPLISILMATYNTPEKWLREALDSVINQAYENWELCIADDASPQPHVKKVLEEYKTNDCRIKVVYKILNSKVSAALNSALNIATGEFTVLVDHDDILEKDALYHIAKSAIESLPDIIYSDELIVNSDNTAILGHAFRPTFSLELLRSHPYIVHLVAFRTYILKSIGGFDESLTISQDYDLILKAVEKSTQIVHIPKILYRWRTHNSSSGHSLKEAVMETSKKVLRAHLARCGEDAVVLDGKSFNFFEVRYPLQKNLKVAILIPTKNYGTLVKQCIESIQRTVSDVSYEFIIIDHESDEQESLSYFKSISKKHVVLRYKGDFNFSAINNWAVKQLKNNYSHFLFCNNDIEATDENWLTRMLELAQKPDVGIVGAKLYYPTTNSKLGAIQHAGVCVGMFGAAEHYGKFMDRHLQDGASINAGYIGSLITNHEMSSVTAACMLIKSNVFFDVGGFDELAKVGFGDVDICLRVQALGYRILFCANSELIHHESLSRGKSTSDPHPEDSRYFQNRWSNFIKIGDPYYNPNLTIFDTYWNLKRPDDFELGGHKLTTNRTFRKPLFFHR